MTNMSLMYQILAIAILGAALAALWAIYLLRHKLSQAEKAILIEYSAKPPTQAYFFLTAKADELHNSKPIITERQSLEWQNGMRKVGEKLADCQVEAIYLVHGTFAGKDPFGLAALLKSNEPAIDMALKKQRKLQNRIKKSYDLFSGDFGNFTENYRCLLQESLKQDIPCHLFHWGSGNHHIARVEAAVDLALKLSRDLNKESKTRILLIGHSHAGQIFALLSHFYSASSTGKQVLELLNQFSYKTHHIKRALRKIRRYKLDFVTLGAPIRYSFHLSKNLRLIHFVNHSARTTTARPSIDSLNTSGDDAMHIWGIVGSDYLATTRRERSINRSLDQLLGSGIDPVAWLKNTRIGMRVSPFGQTFLINYQNNHPLIPGTLKSILGHGIYTRYEFMLFTTQTICQSFYNRP